MCFAGKCADSCLILVAFDYGVQNAKNKHHHIWARSDHVNASNWARVQAAYRWVEESPAEGHVVDGFFHYVAVGPLCFHQHCDLKFMDISQRERDLLSAYREDALPPVDERQALKALVNNMDGDDEGLRVRPKKRKLNRFQRAMHSYRSADKAWLLRGRALVDRLASKGFAGILPLGKFDKALSHMQKNMVS